jgi:hypothetical protein
MWHLYDGLPASATTARWVFEFRMHQLLWKKQTIRLFPIIQDSSGPTNCIYKGYPGTNAKKLKLPRSNEHPFVEGDVFHANCYYRPRSTSFPAIDSLLLIRPRCSLPILLMFRITQDTEEHVSEEDLRRIDSLGLSPITRKYYVVVTPTGVKPEIMVPKAYRGRDGGTKLSDRVFRVFNYSVSVDEVFAQ